MLAKASHLQDEQGDGAHIASTRITNIHFQNVLASSIIMDPSSFVFDFFKNGASTDLRVNGSVTPVNFEYKAPFGLYFLPKDISFVILDAGAVPTTFGALPKLANGLLFQLVKDDGTVVKDFLGGNPIRQNSDFFYMAGSETRSRDATGATPDAVEVRFNILTTGACMVAKADEKLRITVRDNLTGLDEFKVSINGLFMPPDFQLPGSY